MKRFEKSPRLTIFAMIAATLFAKSLGLVRNMVTAWTLGASTAAVAFAAASRIPSAVFDLLFSAAILGCFIPGYSRAKEESERACREYSGAFLGAAAALAAVLALLGVAFSPQIVALTAPSISKEAAALAAELLRIMFPMMVFAAGAYTLTGMLQAKGSFILPAGVSAVSNLFTSAYLVLARESFSVHTLAWVFVFSWFLQFLTLCIPLCVKRNMPLPRIDLGNKHLRACAAEAPRTMAGSWFAPAAVLSATFFASFVSDTAFLIYDYAVGIYTIVAGIAVYGVGNFVFPRLSTLAAQGDTHGFASRLSNSLFSVLLTVVPVFAAVLCLSYEGVALLYLRGSFTEELARACARALSTVSTAMPACAAAEILCRAFYACGKAKVPMYSTLAAVFSLVLFNCASLAFSGNIGGICASFALAQWVQALVLLAFAIKHFPGAFTKQKTGKLALILPGAALCTVATWYFSKKIPLFSINNSIIELFLKITIVFIAEIVIYLIYIYFIGFISRKKRGEEKE